MTGLIFDSFVDARTFVDGNTLAKRVQRLAVGTVTSFDALSAAFRIERNVVARPSAAVGANLVRLTTSAVNTFFLKKTKNKRNMMDACNFIRVEGNKRETHLMMTMMMTTTIKIIKQTRIDVNIEKITTISPKSFIFFFSRIKSWMDGRWWMWQWLDYRIILYWQSKNKKSPKIPKNKKKKMNLPHSLTSGIQSTRTPFWEHSLAYAAMVGHKHSPSFTWHEQTS